jgi:hypothetical protein
MCSSSNQRFALGVFYGVVSPRMQISALKIEGCRCAGGRAARGELSNSGWGLVARAHIIQVFDQLRFHLLARDDGINEAMIQQEFRSLKSGWQFRLGGVFDDTGTGETDHGSGLGNDQIADGREACHHARRGGVSERADVRQAGL